MLKKLRIQNYALIRHLDMDFDKGFCVITGETGAGKSILLGALGLVLGQRADSGILFDKTGKCVIEAEFDLQGADLQEFFASHDLDENGDDLILRREVLPAGKSRAFVNDTPVTLPVLKELSSNLIDIHSQHETLALNLASFQLKLIDSYLPDKNLLLDYKERFKRYQTCVKELNQRQAERDKARKEYDYNQFLFSELEALQLKPDEQKQMEEELEILSHAESLQEVFSSGLARLEGDEYGVMNTLSSLLKDLKRAAAHHNALAADLPRWESLLIELDDLRKDLEMWNGEVESDPQRKVRYEERLDAIYRLEKKHGVEDVQDLLDLQNKLQGQLHLSENAEEEISRLEEALKKEEEALHLLSSRLTAARKASAQTLREAILASLMELGMEQARLEIAFTPLETFGNEGCDRVAFLFSANLGAPLQEMAKVASGGELSRVMLAVKSVIHQGSLLGTLILDEIDTGVSGKIAAKVARMMKNLSRYMQVVAITHLPQIAAAADVHYRVYKTLENGAAVSNMSRLSAEEHIESVASMLSNGPVTPVALEAARELVEG